MDRIKAIHLVLYFAAILASCFANSAFADQPKSLTQLLDEFILHRGSRAAATDVSDKIYEMRARGETPDEATILKLAALLESPDERISYDGATSVIALGPNARPIRLDVWKLYFRIIDEDARVCGIVSGTNPISYDQQCLNRAFNPDELRWRVCSALASIGDIPSDKESWFRCAGLSK